MDSQPHEAVAAIRKQAPDFAPQVAFILGSGIEAVHPELIPVATIPYQEIPGFIATSIPGHAGQLELGYFNEVPILCFRGRIHSYEGQPAAVVKTMIRSIKLLGCSCLVITNAAGSLHPHLTPGSLLVINDHINFQHTNPLTGPNNDEFGPRFVALNDAYDPRLNQLLLKTAAELGIPLTTGIYFGVSGPNFETPAEIHAYRTLGADAVGMSTIPEVLVARHCGLRLAVISLISNLAVGLSDEKISHDKALQVARNSSHHLHQLLYAFTAKQAILEP